MKTVYEKFGLECRIPGFHRLPSPRIPIRPRPAAHNRSLIRLTLVLPTDQSMSYFAGSATTRQTRM